ncbi:hypothetical protein PLEOSDRAFT_162946 [Pleurotus ostreatus PC15]|uniref:Uncharacterized protein n=1 Tax=Pleurotus ostreatus (strain PC15) TaxID=1137138 RepID=A0A067NGY0_PLEO1|nr:hypothetical protein PLEOSDRAFT_162946 [Pleurotus ostreatus PC15]
MYADDRDMEQLSGIKEKCPQALHWKLRRPRTIIGDIIIEYANDRYERNDVLVPWDDITEMAEQAEYDRQGQAHIDFKNTFSFGTSTSWFEKQIYLSSWSMRVILEFPNSGECFRCIQHEIPRLQGTSVTNQRDDIERTIIDDMYEAVDPLVSDYCHAEIAAIDRGLSDAEFRDEFAELETQLIRHRGSSPDKNDARPCFLILHLEFMGRARLNDRPSFLGAVHWNATDAPLAFPCSNPFQYLSNLHLSFPSTASADRSGRSSSPPHSGPLTITFSEQGFLFLDGTNTVSAGNGLTTNIANRTVVVNYIGAVMGDYFGIVNGGNVGGTNNTNHVHSYSR